MITEVFLNSCFSLILNKSQKVKKDRTIYKDVLDILDFNVKNKSIDIPAIVQTKFDCLKKICEMKLEDRDIENIIDSLSFSEKYKPMLDFLNSKVTEELHLENMLDHIRQVRMRKKLNSLFTNYDQLNGFITSLEGGTFDSIDDLIMDYENIIKTLYTTMQQHNRGIAIESSASLDLSKDSYDSVLKLILEKYSRKNAISTGYEIFDDQIFNGGFEPSRVYIFGGSSGSGKSTIMNNFIVNSAIKPKTPNPTKPDQKNVYVYITLENTIEESLLRTYMPLYNKKISQVLAEISDGIDIGVKLTQEFEKTNSTVIMKYFPAKSISSLDIMAVLDDINAEYGIGCIKGLYIDYLDLLRTDTKYDIYRLELGDITLSLKSLAVEYNIPVITGTQLGRGAYKTQNSNELNLDQISESIKKVEHADFVAMLTLDPSDGTTVHLKVGKNRSGKTNIALDFKVDFSCYKFINGHVISNAKKQTDVSTLDEKLVEIPDISKKISSKEIKEFSSLLSKG